MLNHHLMGFYLGSSEGKVPSDALYFGLFPRLQWKGAFFHSYGGNRNLPTI